MTDERAVSAVFGYVLALGIVTLLIGGLFIAAGDFVESQHDRAIRSELEVVGNRLAADVAAVDRLALAAESNGEVQLRIELPPRVAGEPYQIQIDDSVAQEVHLLTLTASQPAVTVEVRVRTETPMASGTINGGDVVVVYNGTALEVQHG